MLIWASLRNECRKLTSFQHRADLREREPRVKPCPYPRRLLGRVQRPSRSLTPRAAVDSLVWGQDPPLGPVHRGHGRDFACGGNLGCGRPGSLGRVRAHGRSVSGTPGACVRLLSVLFGSHIRGLSHRNVSPMTSTPATASSPVHAPTATPQPAASSAELLRLARSLRRLPANTTGGR